MAPGTVALDVLDGGGDNADRSALPGRETDGPSWIKWAG
jgi:hypothetical protein